MKRRSLIIPVTLTALALSAWLLVRWRRTAAVEVTRAALSWPAGVRSIYAVDWHTHAEGMSLPGAGSTAARPTLDAETKLAGELAIEPLGKGELAISLTRIDRLELRMQGQTVDQGLDPNALVEQRAYLSLSPRGEVTGIRYDAGAPLAVRQALRGLVLELQLTAPAQPTDRWEAVEPIGGGSMRVGYHRDGHDVVREPLALERLDANHGALDGRQTVAGTTRFVLGDGALDGIDSQASWSYTQPGAPAPLIAMTDRFRLSRQRGEALDVASLRAHVPGGEGQPLAQPLVDEGLPARRDARLAHGLDVDKVMLTVEHFEKGQNPALDFVVRAGAYLRLHPEAAQDLVRQFAQPATTFKGRGYILDMLVQAGDANAQAAMRAALASPAARTDLGDFGMLVQRFTMVEAPQADSERFLEDEYRRARHAGQTPAAQGVAATLGAMASRLANAGQPELAAQANALLVGELRAADSAPLKRALLTGLGNARRLDDLDVIRGFAHDDEAMVRVEVAGALRGLDDPGARATLLELAADGNAAVAMNAMDALAQQTLGAADWQAMAKLVAAGRTQVASDGSLVRIIRAHRDAAGADGDAILRALQARNGGGENSLGNEIAALLAGRAS